MIHLVKVAEMLAVNNTGVRPPATIDMTDTDSTNYWARRLNVSPQKLASAIEKVGPSIAAIRQHLRS